jgi:hypothetical protein
MSYIRNQPFYQLRQKNKGPFENLLSPHFPIFGLVCVSFCGDVNVSGLFLKGFEVCIVILNAKY